MKGLYEKVTGRDSPLSRDPSWEDVLNATNHGLLAHRSVWAASRRPGPGPARGAVEGLRAGLLYCRAMLGSGTGVGQTGYVQTREKVPSSGLPPSLQAQ